MQRLIRYTKPTKFDQAPEGTLWECRIDSNFVVLFIQINKDETAPHWIKMKSFLLHVFKKHFDNEAFIKECLRQYELSKEG